MKTKNDIRNHPPIHQTTTSPIDTGDPFAAKIHPSASPEGKWLDRQRHPIGWRPALGLAALVLSLVPGPAHGADTESVDFNSGELTSSFSDNVLFGDSPYALAPVGLNRTPGVSVADTLKSEGTLVYKKKSYDLSTLTSLEISCFFQRRSFGAASHALNLGLIGKSDGHLSGVAGPAYAGLRLHLADGELRMQFDSKSATTAGPNHSRESDPIPTVNGQWYQMKVIFSRVDATSIRVTGMVSNAAENGQVGAAVGYFGPTNFGLPGFQLAGIAEGHELWAAVRANGAGGTAALDNFQVIASSAPEKPKSPATAPAP